MSMRATSLQATNVLAINREIDSKYDAVLAVRDKLVEIEKVADLDIEQLLTDLQNAQDFTGISVVAGSVAGWNAETKTITVPTLKGDQGIQGPVGATGAIGATGAKGDRGLTGAAGVNGKDGKDGTNGTDGINGRDGIDGKDLTIEQISYNSGTGRFVWQFSDGTSYETPDLRGAKGTTGDKGDKGDQGTGVHHIKGTSTTNSQGTFGQLNATDTYTVYGDAAETLNLGTFTVRNGMDVLSSVEWDKISNKPTTLSGYGITDADTSAQVTSKISTAIASLVDTAPATLDTLNELAAALGDDPNFATTVTNSIAGKVAKNTDIVAGTGTKITYDAKGLVTGSTSLVAGDIPSLDASKITTGTLPVSRGGTGTTTSTGTGNVVLSSSPILVTPNIGVATGTSFNSITGLSSTTPTAAGTAAVGVGTTAARADHVHPAQTSVTGSAGSVANSKIIKFDTGTTEGTDLYTFNGSSAKTINIVAGTGITLGKAAGTITINGSGGYTLPAATSTSLGGIKINSDTVQTIAANTVTNTANRTYGIQVNASGQAVVNVPWVDTVNAGTVTSVGGTGTVSGLTLSGTVTNSGNLTLGGTLLVDPSNFASQTANTVLIAPNGSAGTPTFRVLASADIPSLDWSKITTGKPTTISGYGITDTYTKTEIDTITGNINSALDTINGVVI